MTRPVFDLRCGAWTLAERHQRLLPGAAPAALVRPAIAPLCRLEHPNFVINDPESLLGQSVLFVNGRWLPPSDPLVLPDGDIVGLCDGQVAFARVQDYLPTARSPIPAAQWQNVPHITAGGILLNQLWNLLDVMPLSLPTIGPTGNGHAPKPGRCPWASCFMDRRRMCGSTPRRPLNRRSCSTRARGRS